MLILLLLNSVCASWISSCPTVTCSDTEVATDDDDWCVRINLDKESPRKSTVQIRQCVGETKSFCDWGMPGNIEKNIWPYDIDSLMSRQGSMNFFDVEFIHMGRCVDSN